MTRCVVEGAQTENLTRTMLEQALDFKHVTCNYDDQ